MGINGPSSIGPDDCLKRANEIYKNGVNADKSDVKQRIEFFELRKADINADGDISDEELSAANIPGLCVEKTATKADNTPSKNNDLAKVNEINVQRRFVTAKEEQDKWNKVNSTETAYEGQTKTGIKAMDDCDIPKQDKDKKPLTLTARAKELDKKAEATQDALQDVSTDLKIINLNKKYQTDPKGAKQDAKDEVAKAKQDAKDANKAKTDANKAKKDADTAKTKAEAAKKAAETAKTAAKTLETSEIDKRADKFKNATQKAFDAEQLAKEAARIAKEKEQEANKAKTDADKKATAADKTTAAAKKIENSLKDSSQQTVNAIRDKWNKQWKEENPDYVKLSSGELTNALVDKQTALTAEVKKLNAAQKTVEELKTSSVNLKNARADLSTDEQAGFPTCRYIDKDGNTLSLTKAQFDAKTPEEQAEITQSEAADNLDLGIDKAYTGDKKADADDDFKVWDGVAKLKEGEKSTVTLHTGVTQTRNDQGLLTNESFKIGSTKYDLNFHQEVDGKVANSTITDTDSNTKIFYDEDGKEKRIEFKNDKGSITTYKNPDGSIKEESVKDLSDKEIAAFRDGKYLNLQESEPQEITKDAYEARKKKINEPPPQVTTTNNDDGTVTEITTVDDKKTNEVLSRPGNGSREAQYNENGDLIVLKDKDGNIIASQDVNQKKYFAADGKTEITGEEFEKRSKALLDKPVDQVNQVTAGQNEKQEPVQPQVQKQPQTPVTSPVQTNNSTADTCYKFKYGESLYDVVRDKYGVTKPSEIMAIVHEIKKANGLKPLEGAYKYYLPDEVLGKAVNRAAEVQGTVTDFKMNFKLTKSKVADC